MRDLFTCDLDEVVFEDVLAFVDLDASKDNRPAEGARVDYKQGVPQDLGDVVCAFANGFGGLVFVGVDEEDGKPTAIPGLPKVRTDLKTRLANQIQSTIQPRPPFSIRVLDMPSDPAREIAIVRVGEGDAPPYIYRRKVSVRVEDKSEPASLADLERLFRQRADAQAHSERPWPIAGLLQSTVADDPNKEDGNSHVGKSWARLTIRPERAVPRVLDKRTESEVLQALRQAIGLRSLNVLKVIRRDASSTDVKIGFGSERLFWRCYDNGAQVMAANIGSSDQYGDVALLALLAQRWSQSFLAACRIFEGHGWLGRVQFCSELVLGDARVSQAVPSNARFD